MRSTTMLTHRLYLHLLRPAGPQQSDPLAPFCVGCSYGFEYFVLRRSIPGLKFMNKAAEMDPKKQKRMEKEEKEFRKKFKVRLILYHTSLSISTANNVTSVTVLDHFDANLSYV